MNGLVEGNQEPVWKRPVWITAIASVISIFLTVPDVVGTYLSKKQDIELAKQKTEAARLENVESKQNQEFEIVKNTLAHQGTERVFMLRYLAATLDDPQAKFWAKEELERTESYGFEGNKKNELIEEFEVTHNKFLTVKELSEKEKLKIKLDEIMEKLQKSDRRLATLAIEAGLPKPSPSKNEFTIVANYKSDAEIEQRLWFTWTGSVAGREGINCEIVPSRKSCTAVYVADSSVVPTHVIVRVPRVVTLTSLEIIAPPVTHRASPPFTPRRVGIYSCGKSRTLDFNILCAFVGHNEITSSTFEEYLSAE